MHIRWVLQAQENTMSQEPPLHPLFIWLAPTSAFSGNSISLSPLSDIRNPRTAGLLHLFNQKQIQSVSRQNDTMIRKPGFSNKLNSAAVSHQSHLVLFSLNIPCLRQHLYFHNSLKILMISLKPQHKEIHCHPTGNSTFLTILFIHTLSQVFPEFHLGDPTWGKMSTCVM